MSQLILTILQEPEPAEYVYPLNERAKQPFAENTASSAKTIAALDLGRK